jgi:hypothetical protein
MRPSLILPSSVTSFHDYYRLNAPTDAVTEALGYHFVRDQIALPFRAETLDWVEGLQTRFQKILPHITLDSELARRELLIAPILSEMVASMGIALRIEFDIAVNEQLRGDLDYYLESKTNLLVVEAKNADTSRGATQLIAEMIALDQWTTSTEAILYAALSTGETWRFFSLVRATRTVTQDLHLFRVPEDLTELCLGLVAILEGNAPQSL